MLKFLRQYNQWILAVGGTLLLITFLMPTAIQSCAQQSAVSGSTWATYEGGKKVTGADLENAQRELRVVELLANPAFRQLGIDREPAHWWLAAHEAQHGGFVGGAGDGEAVLAEVLDMMACKAAVKAGDALSEREIAELLQQLDAIERATNCPHGRPTAMRIPWREIERRFGRG